MTHKTRLHLNSLLNERWKTRDAVWIEVGDVKSPNMPQDFWLHVGLVMIAYIPHGKCGDITNAQLLEVTNVGDELIGFKDVESQAEYELNIGW